MARKQTTITFSGGATRSAAVLAVALSLLSAQQAWAALACDCESRGKLSAYATGGRHITQDPEEIQHSSCHHNSCVSDLSEESHHSGAEDLHRPPAAPPAIPATSYTIKALSESGPASCCCLIQATPPETPTFTCLVQQPSPLQHVSPPAIACGSLAAASVNIHGPPGPATSRPLFIIQSSLLI